MVAAPVSKESLLNYADAVEQGQVLSRTNNSDDNYHPPRATMSAMDAMEDMEMDEMTIATTPSDLNIISDEIERPVKLSNRIKFKTMEKVVHITPGSPLMSQLQPPRNWARSWSEFLSRSDALRNTRRILIDIEKSEEDNEDSDHQH